MRSRPQSGLSNQSPFPTPSQSTSVADDESMSKDDISKSLAQKDPSWFKQTPDRSLGSAANRKTHEAEPTSLSAATARRMLPGLSQDSTSEPEKSISPPPDTHSESILGNGDFRMDRTPSTKVPFPTSTSFAAKSVSLQDINLPPPTSDIAPSSRSTVGNTPSLPALSGRMSPERVPRSPSPTKGLGGFVQSAMLKRSDSVNKRWSAQATPGLSRGNSIASVRSNNNTQIYPGTYKPPIESRLGSISRENSPAPTSRPASSHGTTVQRKILPSSGVGNSEDERQSPKDDTEVSARVQTSGHHPSLSGSLPTSNSLPALTSPPSSPSKRWSPTKSSWLENAINKPDSPKPKFSAPQQPGWMADLTKAKQQKSNAEPVRQVTSRKVQTTGFLRSPPTDVGGKNSSISGLPNGFSAGIGFKELSRSSTVGSQDRTIHDQRQRAGDASEVSAIEDSKRIATPDSSTSRVVLGEQEGAEDPRSGRVSNAPVTSPKSPELLKSHPITPPKPTPTSSPRSARLGKTASGSDEAEFKNVFGKLRRTQTKNYVAPDELKDNITRGKAALNVTKTH